MTEQELKIQEKKAAQLNDEQTKNELYFAPHVDIYETEQDVIVIADMPGVVADDLDLSLEDSVLTIQGRRLPPRQTGRILLEEYETGHYLRRFTVAETIDQERIAASLTDGVLTVRLPKIKPLQPRKIEVQIG